MAIAIEKHLLERNPKVDLEFKPNIAEKSERDYKKAADAFCLNEFVEFTLAVGCPVNCQRYCPQETFIKKYGNNSRMMSFDFFKKILSHIPTNVVIDFGGFCEPFVNPDFVKMAEYAYYHGYKLHVNTTLFGAKTSDVERLINLDYTLFCLHLRDGQEVKFPVTPEYQQNVFRVIEGIPTVHFSLMNKLFASNNRENVTRGVLPKPKHMVFCRKLSTPQFVVLPNGDVQLCCMDFGLQNKLGNLLTENYLDIKKKLKKKGGYSQCKYCNKALSFPQHISLKAVAKVKSKLFRS